MYIIKKSNDDNYRAEYTDKTMLETYSSIGNICEFVKNKNPRFDLNIGDNTLSFYRIESKDEHDQISFKVDEGGNINISEARKIKRALESKGYTLVSPSEGPKCSSMIFRRTNTNN